MYQRRTDDKTNSDEHKKLSYFGMLCWGGRKAACSPCRLVKRLSKQVRVYVNANSALSQILHISPEENQEKAEMTDVISTSKSQQNHFQKKQHWGGNASNERWTANSNTHVTVSILAIFFLTLAGNVSSASKCVWDELSLISSLCLFSVELITEPLKTHKSSLQMTIKNFGIAPKCNDND